MPEDAELTIPCPNFLEGFQDIVYTEILVVLSDNLNQSALSFLEQGKVLYQVKQAFRLTGAPYHGLKRDDALVPLTVNLLPVDEVLPGCRHAPDFAVGAVREDDKGVIPEDMGGGVLVVPEIAIVSVLYLFLDGFKLDEDQR